MYTQLCIQLFVLQGAEAKGAFQKAQIERIFEVLGTPDVQKWPTLDSHLFWASNVQNVRTDAQKMPHVNRLEKYIKEQQKVGWIAVAWTAN